MASRKLQVSVQVLGQVVATVRSDAGERTFTPERRTAAILAYLALEGPTPRSRLAGMLWPDSPEGVARNNLSQALRRFRQATGDAWVEGDAALRLADGVTVDAAELKTRAFSGDPDEVAGRQGELLGGFDYDDSPELLDWLHGEREALTELRRQALVALVERSERAGRFDEAVRHAERLVELDPVAETAHRLLMRMHYLAGDRPAALKAYHRCRKTLERELGVEPLSETKELARRIDRGEVPAPAVRRVERSLPLEVLRPPRLVGREEAWARMEEAWERGQFIVLAGEPGVGKTRLALDFAASKGEHLFLDGRPGDAVVPFATSTRNFRRILEHRPDLELEPWVRRALSQVLPELATDGPPSSPPSPPSPSASSAQGGAHLLEAVLRLVGADLGIRSFVYDDLQFADAASIDAGFYVISSSFPMGRPGGTPHWIACLRPLELSDRTRAVLQAGMDAGHMAWIELEPLGPEATASLLASLDLPALEGRVPAELVAALHDRTGGNALFILETLRNLLETNRLHAPPERLPLGGKVDAIVRQRLARLSPLAQRVAQAAAVLQSDFDLELVGRVLNADAVELIPAWEELERAQVFRGDRFSHDLLYETVLAGVSRPVAVLLHRRAAEALERTAGSPGRIAKHLLAAGDEERAAPWLARAAEAVPAVGGGARAGDGPHPVR